MDMEKMLKVHSLIQQLVNNGESYESISELTKVSVETLEKLYPRKTEQREVTRMFGNRVNDGYNVSARARELAKGGELTTAEIRDIISEERGRPVSFQQVYQAISKDDTVSAKKGGSVRYNAEDRKVKWDLAEKIAERPEFQRLGSKRAQVRWLFENLHMDVAEIARFMGFNGQTQAYNYCVGRGGEDNLIAKQKATGGPVCSECGRPIKAGTIGPRCAEHKMLSGKSFK
jgi:transposase